MSERPIMFRPEMVRAILAGTKTQTRRPIKRGQVFRFCREGEGPCDLDAAERRAINAEPFHWEQGNPAHPSMEQLLTLCPFGVPGDRLWVKETWMNVCDWDSGRPTGEIIYRATWEGEEPVLMDDDGGCAENKDGSLKSGWRSSMMMPRWASRLTLEIVSVRVERVQDISADDAMAEGIGQTAFWTPKELNDRPFEEKWWDDFEFWSRYPRIAYQRAWDSMYAKSPHAWAANPWVWVVEFKRIEAKDGGAEG